MTAYEKLEKHCKRIDSFSHLSAICGWDEACMMPEGGGEARATAMAELSVLLHELTTSEKYRDMISAAEDELGLLDNWQQANLKEAKNNYERSTALNPEFVEELSLVCQKSEQAWRKFRAENNWKEFLPIFKKVVEAKQMEAQLRADKTGLALYDTLIDGYEPGFSSVRIQEIFDSIKAELPELTDKILSRQKPVEAPKGPFPVELQKQLGVEVMQAIGFDFHHGRLDVSHHPFCGGVPEDVRVTTRYSTDEFIQSLMGIVHETGHARYEQCLPKQWLSQPVGMARGMGIHEGQSLLFEMQVAHGDEFIQFVAPKVREKFEKLHPEYDWSAENLKALINKVDKGFIRVDADEVTYPSHIILRFEIEKALIEGEICVDDLPAIWDEKMKTYLGLSTEGNFKDGCMQDVHWPAGLFGYFPSYTLGAMNAAQTFFAAKKQNPQILPSIQQGNFKPLNDWFSDNIWSKGCLYSTDELMTEATGEALNPKYFLDHVKQRYL